MVQQKLLRIQDTVERIREKYNRRIRMDGRSNFNMDIGTAGSGNWGHAGRKGLRGGSAPGGGSANRTGSKEKGYSSNAKKAAATKVYTKAVAKIDALNKKIFNAATEAENFAQEAYDKKRQAGMGNYLKEMKEKYETATKKMEGKEYRSESDLLKDRSEIEDRVSKLNKAIYNIKGQSPEAKSRRKELTFQRDALKKRIKSIDQQRSWQYDIDRYNEDYERVTKEMEDAKEWLKDLDNKKAEMDDQFAKIMDEYDAAADERDRAILKKCSSAEDCKTTQEATDYLRATGVFSEKIGAWIGKGKLLKGSAKYGRDLDINLKYLTDEHAVATAVSIEKMMKDYPGMKGKLVGINARPYSDGSATMAETSNGKITLNLNYYGRKEADAAYESSVKTGYHPEGTDFRAVVDHELTHVMEDVLNKKLHTSSDERVADTVMKEVQKKLYGSYSLDEEDAVRAQVSVYAAKNFGVAQYKKAVLPEEHVYGRNTEFLAEAFAEYRNSEHPREIAQAVGEVMSDMLKKLK